MFGYSCSFAGKYCDCEGFFGFPPEDVVFVLLSNVLIEDQEN